MLLSRTCIFLLVISFSSVITDGITKNTTFGYQTIAAKTDSRRHNTPDERKGDANAESGNKRKREEKEDKKNRYSV